MEYVALTFLICSVLLFWYNFIWNDYSFTDKNVSDETVWVQKEFFLWVPLGLKGRWKWLVKSKIKYKRIPKWSPFNWFAIIYQNPRIIGYKCYPVEFV